MMTDTDSIVFMATPEMWELYKAKFVPFTKTFGGMDLESIGVRIIVIWAKEICLLQGP